MNLLDIVVAVMTDDIQELFEIFGGVGWCGRSIDGLAYQTFYIDWEVDYKLEVVCEPMY